MCQNDAIILGDDVYNVQFRISYFESDEWTIQCLDPNYGVT